jgi:hypothetical protein
MRHGAKSTSTEKEEIFQGIFLEIIVIVVVVVVVVTVVDFDVIVECVGIIFVAAVVLKIMLL